MTWLGIASAVLVGTFLNDVTHSIFAVWYDRRQYRKQADAMARAVAAKYENASN